MRQDLVKPTRNRPFWPPNVKGFRKPPLFFSTRRKGAACSRNRRLTSMPGSMQSLDPAFTQAFIVQELEPKRKPARLLSPPKTYDKARGVDKSRTGSRTTLVRRHRGA